MEVTSGGVSNPDVISDEFVRDAARGGDVESRWSKS